MAQDDISKRDKTLASSKIDEEYIAHLAVDGWQQANNQRRDYLDREMKYEQSWRDLTSQEGMGPWDNSANFKSKLILKSGKATHARLWQLFSNPAGFYQADARTEAFKDREANVKKYMDFVIESYANGKQGCKDEWDTFLWDVVFKGSGFLKCYWRREIHQYEEVVPTLEVTEEISFDKADLTGTPTRTSKSKLIETEVVKTDIIETPQVRRILWEDICMPIGYSDPQESPWVEHRVFMTNDEIKAKVDAGIFYSDAADQVLASTGDKRYTQNDLTNEIKRNRAETDGSNIDANDYDRDVHVVFEWYGRAYVEAEVDELEFRTEVNKMPKEIVAWVHKGTRRVLGWTYLHRISPGGIRPIFKADFVKFPDRQNGVGVAELIYEEQRYQEGIINMRMDNGQLASLPMFTYRQSSGLKPQNLRVKPGQGIPVDDVNDMKVFQFPFLQGFGYQEESSLEAKAQGLLALDEIQMGIAPDRVGALRTAAGSNQLAQNAGIQLEIHFDRLARCIDKVLQFLFRLCRERMPNTLYYRVTGERGQPIFGEVNREDLKGEYDFKIAVDILGQSQLEKQQQATLCMSTLINPAFLQSSVVTPENMYNLCKNFLKVQKMGRIDDYITKPQGYQDRITPAERMYRLAFGLFETPPIESTVRLDEDHKAALQTYQQFEDSDLMGLLTPSALAALQRLKQRHMQLDQAQNAGGSPNLSGVQIPRGGYIGQNANGPGAASGQQSLLPAGGGVNGPVV